MRNRVLEIYCERPEMLCLDLTIDAHQRRIHQPNYVQKNGEKSGLGQVQLRLNVQERVKLIKKARSYFHRNEIQVSGRIEDDKSCGTENNNEGHFSVALLPF